MIKAKTRARESLRPVTPILNCLFDALRTVLETFGYPNLAINMVKEQLKVKKKNRPKATKKTEHQEKRIKKNGGYSIRQLYTHIRQTQSCHSGKTTNRPSTNPSKDPKDKIDKQEQEA